MIPHIDLSTLKYVRWSQFAMRFILGGTITVRTGLVTQHWGPIVGGLFLTFPAIFPASATLIERHETEKKQKARIQCHARGRKAAALDAAGAVLGGWGLASFGCIAWLLLPGQPAAWVLTLAGITWLGVSVALWWICQHL